MPPRASAGDRRRLPPALPHRPKASRSSRPPFVDWEGDGEDGAHACGAVDGETTAERLGPVAQSTQTSAGRAGAAAPVVGHDDPQYVRLTLHDDLDAGRC